MWNQYRYTLWSESVLAQETDSMGQELGLRLNGDLCVKSELAASLQDPEVIAQLCDSSGIPHQSLPDWLDSLERGIRASR